MIHESSWTGLKRKISLLSKLFNTTGGHVSNSKTYRKHFTTLSIQLKINIALLNEVPNKDVLSWLSFPKAELINAINKCNNSLTPGPDKLLWSHLKAIIKNEECINKLINIANTCIDLNHWPSHFKISTMIIIPKPAKILCDSTKSFYSIVLLNTTGKLFKKMIGEWLQFLLISNNFVHSCQLGGLKYHSSINTGVALTHIIWLG